MLAGAADGFDRSITLTVPVVVAAVTWEATTWVPYELIVGSPGLAGRPPSLLTYSLLPTTTRSRGALPTSQLCLTVPAAASIATTRFCPLTAEYTVEPSDENTASPTSACLGPSAATGTNTGAVTLPSGFTVNRV